MTSSRYFLTVILSTMIAVFGCVVVAQAQSAGATSAAISGIVNDSEGAAISGATIIIKQLETNVEREVISNENGNFSLQQLPPGLYEATVTADGFKSATSHITLPLGVVTHINFTLVVGAVSDVVEVQADDVSEEGKTESSTSIDSIRIDALPINRRDFLSFALTAPRVTADRLPVQGAAATSGISFNGQSARVNNITIDGLSNIDFGSGSVRSTFSQDAVQEFQIVSDSYNAEFGRSLSGNVNIITKGGGNDFHGSLFLFNRNDKISARDVFAVNKPPFSQYQFGATLGGPIKKDKAFFFTSFERVIIDQNSVITISDNTVAAARRNGIFINNGNAPFANTATTVLARTDYRFSPTDTFYFRYNYGGTYNGSFDPFGGLKADTRGSVQRLDDSSFAFNNVYANTGSNLINETRVLYSQRDQDVQSASGPGGSLIAPEGTVEFGPLVGLQSRQERLFQIVDTVTLTRGRHQIKFGIDYNRLNTPDKRTNLPLFSEGSATFSPLDFTALTGIPNLPVLSGIQAFDPGSRTPAQQAFLMLASTTLPGLVKGFPANVPLVNIPLPLLYVQGFGDSSLVVSSNFFSAFVQDDFKIKPNLLIKAGLRYDINRVDFVPNNNGNISPRLAVSYRPKALPRMNIRASYGLFQGVPLIGTALLSQITRTGQYQVVVSPFPFSVLPFLSPTKTFPKNMLPTNVPINPQLSETFTYQPDLRNSYSQQINLGVEYLVDRDTLVAVDYVFIRGIKLFAARQTNPVVRPVPNSTLQSLLTGRVDPTKGQVTEFESAFDSYYHGLTLSINRRFAKGFSLLASYTYSKAIDNLFDIRTDVADKPLDPLKPGDERGLSIQDARSRFVLSGVVDLGATTKLLKDFQLATIININSGRPYNLFTGVDINMNGDSGDGDRPLGIGRNVGITPGFANVDMRLTRTIKFKERYRFEGFMEIFNLFNRVNISEIDRTFPPDVNGNFNLPPKDNGRFIAPKERYRNAFAPRQFQFGFRFTF